MSYGLGAVITAWIIVDYIKSPSLALCVPVDNWNVNAQVRCAV
jgi:hypothetical protein